jgi:hypothetical protein
MFATVCICRARLLVCWAICLLATLPGCSCSRGVDANPRKPVFPVTGELFYNGAPAKHVMVLLQPVDEAAKAEVWPQGFPRADVAPDGKFAVGTYEAQDGAPAGEYLILVIPTDGALTEPQRVAGDAPSLAPAGGSGPGARYSTAENPAGRCVVEAKENKLPRLSLGGGT